MVEVRSDAPLVDMRMMRLPVVWTVNLVAFLFGVGMYAVMGFLPEFLQTSPSAGYGFGLSVTRSGLMILPLSVVMFVAGLWCGRLTIRYGGKIVMIAGSVISIPPFVMLIVAHSHLWEILLTTGLMGAGFGLAFSAMSALIVAGVAPEQTGVASGMNANIRTIGGSIGAALMSSVVTASARHGGLPTVKGYDHGFDLLAIAAVGAAAAGLLVPSARRSLSRAQYDEAIPHAELSLVAAGTLVGDESE
jgi:predicted MFS family arabinose efflux permease